MKHSNQDNGHNVFYRPGNRDQTVATPQFPESHPSVRVMSRLRSVGSNPFFLPIVVILGFLVLLSVVTIIVQGNRLKSAERDFNVFLDGQSNMARILGDEFDLERWTQYLDSIAIRGTRASSGIFGGFLPSGRGLARKARQLNLAVIKVRESQPGAGRNDAILQLGEAFNRIRVRDSDIEFLSKLMQQNLMAWEQNLVEKGATLPSDGRLPEWRRWSEELESLRSYDHERADRICHVLYEARLGILEERWTGGQRLADYGEAFAAHFHVHDHLGKHRCVSGARACNARWSAVCRNLFMNWARDVRDRAQRGERVESLARQFDAWEEQARELEGFSEARIVVDRSLAQIRSR